MTETYIERQRERDRETYTYLGRQIHIDGTRQGDTERTANQSTNSEMESGQLKMKKTRREQKTKEKKND